MDKFWLGMAEDALEQALDPSIKGPFITFWAKQAITDLLLAMGIKQP